MSEIDVPPPRPKRRILVRLLRGFLILVVLMIVTYLVADQILLRKVQHQREAFKERFGALRGKTIAPQRILDEYGVSASEYMADGGALAQLTAHNDAAAAAALAVASAPAAAGSAPAAGSAWGEAGAGSASSRGGDVQLR